MLVRVASMADSAVLFSLVVLMMLSKGQTAVIQTQQTVVEAVGQNTSLHCHLKGAQSKHILQVSWQKELPEGTKNLASFHKEYGTQVNPDFKDKMEFRYAGRQTFMFVRQLTEQDEGCYCCLFITYPKDTLTGRTCLQVYELHEPVLHVREPDSAGESVVSCSATGRPAPTVTLNVTQQHLHFSNYNNTASVNNNNGTVTVTTTAVLSGFHGNSTQVGCAARVLSGPQMETFVMIPEVKLTDGPEKESGPHQRDLRWPLIIVFLLVVFCCVAAIMLRKNSQNRSPEMNEMCHVIKHPQNTEAPSAVQDNSELRKWTPPKRTEENNITVSHSAARRLQLDQC